MKRRTDFSRCDLFGQRIALTFKGHSDYRSVFGSLITIGSVLVFAIFFGIRTRALMSGESASMFVTDLPVAADASLNLQELGYFFAVERVQPEVGTWRLRAIKAAALSESNDADRERSQQGRIEEETTEIPLKLCTDVDHY